MKTKLQRIFMGVTFALVFVMASCSTGTPAATLIPSPTSTSIPTPVRTIETLRADPNYMAGCEKINSRPEKAQVGYQGIYPGRTHENEIEERIGKPLKINYLGGWEYDDMVVGFDKTIVNELYVDGDGVTALKDFVMQYGCPDVIYAKSVSEEPSYDYAELLFTYHRIGFDFKIDHIPAELSDMPYTVAYFIPGTLEDYKNSFLWLKNLSAAKPINWGEAVK